MDITLVATFASAIAIISMLLGVCFGVALVKFRSDLNSQPVPSRSRDRRPSSNAR